MEIATMETKTSVQYIISDPAICHGEPTFRGTRILVADVLEQVASGMAYEAIIEEWRYEIDRDAIAAAVRVSHLLPEDSGISETEWLQAAAANPAFDFLKDPEEDIYTLAGGDRFVNRSIKPQHTDQVKKMETITTEAKLTPKLLEELENIIHEGWYTDRSEAIRDAVRKLIMERRLSKEERDIIKDVEWGLHG
ncbi:MAG: DUF433 domain-containing protein [archaeon]|nr:DUF433 domain-containing protein [archaeon]